jgi:glycogen phosphorylase
LGRIAADSLDSLVTRNVPCWGYGMRYDYGVFRQELTESGEQVEVPDYWLERGNPWEIERPDVSYKIRMYGRVVKDPATNRTRWEGGDVILATAYDMPITGYNTFNTNNLRLWRSRPYDEYEKDLACEDELGLPTGEEEYQSNYFKSVEKCQEAEYITSIFYPNDNLQRDKEIRLKQ